ncbi:FAD-dependent oxidoreductase [Sphingorhabdus arenilitoris]|uniref:FAD-dependent oxidoreductase n=1 Tax=Sphingorhabdus arenilitoris TaxID=1490041 RepID=A0ABV8RDA5_9SPHN
MIKKLGLVVILASAIVAFFYFGLSEYLSLDYFKARQADFDAGYAANPWLFIGGFFLIYVATTALSLPGAAILTLVAGALFGLVTGTIIVSFASTIGASLAFLSSRFVLRDWVQAKFGDRLKGLNEGLARDGAFYLFTIRMIPVVPFFVVNLAMGLTKIRLSTYYWVSQLGMLAGTIVYVNAGTQIANIESASGLFTPAVIGSFAALAIFPWITKAIIAAIKRRRAYKGWTKPKKFDRNLIVLGAGSAGLVSSYIAATVKAKVTLIEANEMGGDCLNTGCVPSKALIKSAKIASHIEHADRYGLKAAKATLDFAEVMARVKSVIKDIEPHDSVERFTGLGVDCVAGYAKFVDPWTVEIAHQGGTTSRMTGKNFIIATGAAPFVPPLPGMEESGYLTSETLWDALSGLPNPPQRMIIMGGGPIGCELAQSFQRLGSQVTIVEMADRLLGKEDAEAAAVILEHLQKEGVDVRLTHKAVRVEGGNSLIAESEGGETAIAYDALIVAVGRRARVTGFGLEQLGLLDENGRMVVDDSLTSLMPHIYTAGDVAGKQQFTHGASHEAWHATINSLASPFKKYRVSYDVLPRVTYTDPEVATVGLTEEEAAQQDKEFDVTHYHLDDLDRAIAESETAGFVKVITAKGSDKILGVTIVASHAGEMLAQFTLAMRNNMGLSKLAQPIAPYPTWNEADKYVVGQYKLARKPEKLLAFAEKYFNWRRG